MSFLCKEKLIELYIDKKYSSAKIAQIFNCSENKVNYWLKKYDIPKRSISEAIYIKANPAGDPFFVKTPETMDEAILYGIGVGLYWGEGTKMNKYAVRLGNTDPALIKKFIEFLIRIYNIDQKKLRFGLQIFSDMKPKKALNFWRRELGVSVSQFYKIMITPSNSIGTYRNKTKYGVLTIHFNNKKLRDILCEDLKRY